MEFEDQENSALPDSLKSKCILAVFEDEESLSVLLIPQHQTQVVKYAYFKNGQVLVDSLILRGADTLYSPKFKCHYMVTAKTVIVVYDQKIIHPSSNWQGQTPWKERVEKQYVRKDLN